MGQLKQLQIFLKTASLIFLILTSFNTHSKVAGNGKVLVIQPIVQEDPIRSGSQYTIKGSLCFSHVNKNKNCYKVNQADISFKATFPSSDTNVTDKVKLTFNSVTNKYDYEYKTDDLSEDGESQFTLSIGNEGIKTRIISYINNILKKRVSYFEKIIKKYQRRRGWFKRFFVKYFQRLLNKTKAIIRYYQKIINNDPDVLAKLIQPLKVGNNQVSELLHISTIARYRLETKLNSGVLLDKENISGRVLLTNYGKKKVLWPKYNKKFLPWIYSSKNYISIDVGPENIISRKRIRIKKNDSKEFTFQGISLDKSSFVNVSIETKFRKLYTVNLPIQGLIDNIDPQIQIAKPSGLEIFLNANSENLILEGEVLDSFGKLESNDIEIQLSRGSDFLDLVVDKNQVADDKVTFSSNLPQLEEGNFVLRVSAKDVQGNVAEPVSIEIVSDLTSPLLSFSKENNFYTTDRNFQLGINVNDVNEVTSNLFFNDVLVVNTNEKNFGTGVELIEGRNTFLLEGRDSAGNMNIASLDNIVLDTTPPMLGLNINDGQVVNQERFLLTGVVTERNLEQVILEINGERVFTSTTPSISYEAFLNNGDNSVRVTVVDLAGNQLVVERNLRYVPEQLPPVANLVLDKDVTLVNENIIFDASSSESGSSAIGSYSFTFVINGVQETV